VTKVAQNNQYVESQMRNL